MNATFTRIALLGLLFMSACAPAPAPEAVAVDDAYERAVALSADGETDRAMAALSIALQHDPAAVQRALLDPAFHDLRDEDEFRAAVHEAAIAHEISSLSLAPPDEPGEWITIEGTAVHADDESPVPGAVIRVFATDKDGLYHPEIEGEGTPRIFGTLVADKEGNFEFRTVRPGPYPGTRNPRHIHIRAEKDGMRLTAPYYAVFDDDPLLFEPQNAEPRGEAIRIAMKEVDGAHRGTIILPMR